MTKPKRRLKWRSVHEYAETKFGRYSIMVAGKKYASAAFTETGSQRFVCIFGPHGTRNAAIAACERHAREMRGK